MARQKLQRFLHNSLADNVIEKGKPFYTTIKGNWNKEYFKNDQPIVLELACGKGEYTTGLAAVYPDRNYIGIDIKGDRIQRGSKRAMDNNLANVAFLRAGIQFLDEFFVEGEVDEIWLIHPDPQPKDKDEKKRLTNSAFLSLYAMYLKKGGLFRLKTDNPFLYEYSLGSLGNHTEYRILDHTNDLYHSPLLEEHQGVKTHYEHLFVEKGFTINYIKSVRL